MDSYDELLELVLAYSSKQVKYLARWIIGYNRSDDRKEQELRLERLLYLNRFQRLADGFVKAAPKERGALDRELFDYYSTYVKPMVTNLHRKELDELCYKSLWPEAVELLRGIDADMEAAGFEREYERLVTDSEYLIGQIVKIMRIEYSKRLEGARRATEEYIEPHRVAFERLDANLREAREGLRRLERSGLPDADRAPLARRLEAKLAEMEAMREAELGNIRRVRGFLGEIQKASRMFDTAIGVIERKRDQIEERRRFESLAARLELETPEMGELFSDMKGGLEGGMGKIRESFALLNGAFQERLLDIIGDQERMNRIFETGGGTPDSGADARNHDYYEEVLRILKGL